MKIRSPFRLLSAVLPLLFCASAWAHHGWSSYDAEKTVKVEVPLAEVRYRNPHAEVEVDYQGKRWQVILAPISRMESRGLRQGRADRRQDRHSRRLSAQGRHAGDPRRADHCRRQGRSSCADRARRHGSGRLAEPRRAGCGPGRRRQPAAHGCAAPSRAYPVVNLLHLLGLVLLVGPMLLLDLRLLGAARHFPLPAVSRRPDALGDRRPAPAAAQRRPAVRGRRRSAARQPAAAGQAAADSASASPMRCCSVGCGRIGWTNGTWCGRARDRLQAALSALCWLATGTLGRLIAYG